jgi:hypothetical protein
VRLVGTPEQAIYKLATTWTTDRDGSFVFHAPDGAGLEATAGEQCGWAQVTGAVAVSKQLKIQLGDAPARDATITGRVVDEAGEPLADVLIAAEPDRNSDNTRVGTTATTGGDGTFLLEGLDRNRYAISADAEGYPAQSTVASGGARGIQIVLSAGQTISGTIVTSAGDPVPAFTLLAFRRDGAVRIPVATRSLCDVAGRFELHVLPGTYELVASASGWAPSPRTSAAAGQHDVRLVVAPGAVVRGVVRSLADHSPIGYARVMREAVSGGASAQPADAGTVTRTDGSFELAGVPAGPVSLTVGAGGFHERIVAGLTAKDGDELGPIELELRPLASGEEPKIELVGIGVQLVADPSGLRVIRVFDGSGAQAAGIVAGDHITNVEGVDVAELGLDGAIAKIRGVPDTTVAITLMRESGAVTLNIERRRLRA